MKSRFLTITGLLLICSSLYAAEDISIDYQYTGDLSLSDARPTLSIGEFSDDRGVTNPRLITDATLGDVEGGYQAEAPLTEIIRDAFVQAFTAGGAKMVAADPEMQIVGKIVSSQAQLVDRGGVESMQITIRTNVQLQEGSRTRWETVLFGRGVVPVDEGMAGAVRAALDRSLRELINDDYFRLELQ